MCERYVVPDQPAAEREFLPATAWWKFAPRFNVAAPQYVPAVRVHERQTEGIMLRWGFIPSWVEHEPDGPPSAAVPMSDVETSDLYRTPWLNGQRCILPIAGFYTWQLTRERYRQPFFVRLWNRPVFGVAALWDRWVSDEDDVIESCSVISVAANELLRDISVVERGMPAILRREDYGAWLKGSGEAARAALRPYDVRWMRAHAVSPRVNCATEDDPDLILSAS